MKHFIIYGIYQWKTLQGLYRKTGLAESSAAAGTLPTWTTHTSETQLHHAHALLRYKQDVWPGRYVACLLRLVTD